MSKEQLKAESSRCRIFYDFELRDENNKLVMNGNGDLKSFHSGEPEIRFEQLKQIIREKVSRVSPISFDPDDLQITYKKIEMSSGGSEDIRTDRAALFVICFGSAIAASAITFLLTRIFI